MNKEDKISLILVSLLKSQGIWNYENGNYNVTRLYRDENEIAKLPRAPKSLGEISGYSKKQTTKSARRRDGHKG